MAMTTERYCATLESLDRVKAVQAIHAALLQINALDSIDADSLDFEGVKDRLRECLSDVGHMGFPPATTPKEERFYVLNAALRDTDTGEEFWHATVLTSEITTPETRQTLLLEEVNRETAGWAGPYTLADLSNDGRLCWSESLQTVV